MCDQSIDAVTKDTDNKSIEVIEKVLINEPDNK